jgi:pimeloyl-ACP methyl ester carboxylesterase
MELGYSRWNSAQNEKGKILLLHGMGGTGALWRPIAAALEDHYSILAPDQRGHGRSRIPHVPGSRDTPQYTPLEYGRDLVETLAALDFHPAWVIGHSMGVRSACALAHLKEEWVQGLILVDLGFSGAAGGGLGEGLASFLKKLPMEFQSRAEARSFMQTECPDPAIGQYLIAVSQPLAQGGITFPFDRAALIETIYAARDASVRDWVRALAERKKPVLVLRGALSEVWTAEEFETEKKNFAKYPSVRFETIEGTGHGLPFEKRMEFVGRVLKMIEG